MNKILGKLFGAAGGNIAEKISGIIDKHTFSKVEKAQFEKASFSIRNSTTFGSWGRPRGVQERS